MEYLISSIIACLFGIAFLVWGIYQIKTGKMVAKRNKVTVDEPKQVGWIFLIVGIAGLWLSFLMGAEYFMPAKDNMLILSIIANSSFVFMGLVDIFMLGAACYGFKNKRIFGVKNTTKTSKYVKKNYKLVNSMLIISPLLMTVLFFFGPTLPGIASMILMIAFSISLCVLAFSLSKIERGVRKS